MPVYLHTVNSVRNFLLKKNVIVDLYFYQNDDDEQGTCKEQEGAFSFSFSVTTSKNGTEEEDEEVGEIIIS